VLVGMIQRIYDVVGRVQRTYDVVGRIRVHEMMIVRQRKSGNAWIYNTVCIGCT
jgi:hypothetical protein